MSSQPRPVASTRPILVVTVGLPGVGKTTVARELAATLPALRLTPDEWIMPLFDGENPEHQRDVIEGRFVWLAHEALAIGTSVVLDFGCWSAEERWALKAVADHAGADCQLSVLELDDAERLSRVAQRFATDPDHQWNLTVDEQAGYRELYTPVSSAEAPGEPFPDPPPGFDTWLQFAADRWPSLPDFSTTPPPSIRQ